MASIRKVKKRLKREIAQLELRLASWKMLGDFFFDSMFIDELKEEQGRIEKRLANLNRKK